MRLLIYWLSIIVFSSLLTASASAQMPDVRAVRIVNLGPGLLDEDSVRTFLSTVPGTPYNPNAVNRDVRALQETERYASVSAALDILPDGEGVDVIFEIRNKPRLRRLTVEGGDRISNRRVANLLDISVGDRVDDHLIAVRARDVYEHYRKRYYIQPELSWTIEVNEEAGTAHVHVRVVEGPRVSVWRIGFDGNEQVPARNLRRVMRQRSWRPWSWLTKGNRLDPHLLEADRDALRRAYMDRGHLDVRIGEPVIEEVSGKRVRIRIPVEEGPVYRIGRVAVDGITLFPEEDVRTAMRLDTGAVASMAAIEADRMNLRDFYGSRGYIRTLTRYRLEPDYDEAVVDLDFQVAEGELASVRDIHIRGNTRTRDKVIRRELAILPGDIYDEVRVRRSENRLRNMGYFSIVRTSDSPAPEPHVYDLTFDVEETRTGQLMAGVGFSSIDRVVGFAEISQNNFDLFGWP